MKFGRVYDLQKKDFVDSTEIMNEVTYLMYHGGGAFTTGEFKGVPLTGDVVQDVINVAKSMGVDTNKDDWMLDFANMLYGREVYYEALFIVIPGELFGNYITFKESLEKRVNTIHVTFWGEGFKTELNGRPAIVNIVSVEPGKLNEVFELGERVVTDDGWFTGFLIKKFLLG